MRAYVLAGGASRRMGSDKARLPHDGWPMAVVLLERLEKAGFRAALVRRGPSDGLPWSMPDGRPVEVVRELDAGKRHPLTGMVTALEHAGTSVVVIPCDLPDLTVEALKRLRVPGVAEGEQLHPLVAHVPFSLLPAIRLAAEQGRSAWSVLGGLPRIQMPNGVLRDRNRAYEDGPLRRLRATLAWLPPKALQRVLKGERARQRARGVLDPSVGRSSAADADGSGAGSDDTASGLG